MPHDPATDALRLKQLNATLAEVDPDLAEEARGTGVSLESGSPDSVVELESIILRRARPVLKIRNNATLIEFDDAEDSTIWRQRLSDAAGLLDVPIRGCGRIDLVGGPIDWVGTGWLIGPGLLVTNRHVAVEFLTDTGSGMRFTEIDGRPIRADVDFLREFDNEERASFELTDIVAVVPAPGPDVALFRVEPVSEAGALARPLDLARQARTTRAAAVIGYPAFDSRIPDIDLMQRIYGFEYNLKRLAPGAVTFIDGDRLFHNCTTLGGNSGSAVIDLDSGEALGLHFSGSFMRTNTAVPAETLRALIAQVHSGTSFRRRVSEAVPIPEVEVIVPLRITVGLGDGRTGISIGRTTQPAYTVPVVDDLIDETEARPEDYLNRTGYDPAFLGEDIARACPLPKVTGSLADDVMEFEDRGQTEHVLRYQHFSVVMSRSRRMCLYSACNIDGSRAKPAARVGWKWDPRIPKSQQIMKECYGSPPKFSRGHMTRRNDPSWGSMDDAITGNRDSMHVTNATPQMQSFNSPIWLELEDYALENAIEDDMRINVMTGPILRANDPIKFGVAVPIAFWKVIAFVHDETGALTATGYRMNQLENLHEEREFVFGGFTSSHNGEAAQVSIRSIEAETGLHFGPLSTSDPLDGLEGIGAAGFVPLATRTAIRYF